MRRAGLMALSGGTLALAALLGACDEPTASREDCVAIVDRIVDIELLEQGLRDPVLATRKRAEMHQRFAGEIDACVGRRLAPRARKCIAEVTDVEALSHRCLR